MRCPNCGVDLDLALVLQSDAGVAQWPEDEVGVIAASMRRTIATCQPKKPGKAEEARHLLDHLGLKADQALQVLGRLEGGDHIDREALRDYLKKGRKRAGCRFCP